MKFVSKSQRKGELAEKIAATFLKKQGAKILKQNYETPYGEIDIICSTRNTVYFVEVKSMFFEKTPTRHLPGFSPERHFTKEKFRKIYLSSRKFIKENNIKNYNYSLMAIYIYKDTKKVRIKMYWNILLHVNFSVNYIR